MAFEPTITVTGNLGSDAELRLTPNGASVTSFTVANTPTKKNAQGTYEDGETLWVRCFVWGKDASGAANELRKGMRVVVHGRLTQQTWTDKELKERVTLEVNVDSYGVKPKNVGAEIPTGVTTDEDPWA